MLASFWLCLFVIKLYCRHDILSKSADFDKYKYSGYNIIVDARRSLSLSIGSRFSKNVLIFVADMSSSGHVDNKKKMSQFLIRVNARVRQYYVDCRGNIFYKF